MRVRFSNRCDCHVRALGAARAPHAAAFQWIPLHGRAHPFRCAHRPFNCGRAHLDPIAQPDLAGRGHAERVTSCSRCAHEARSPRRTAPSCGSLASDRAVGVKRVGHTIDHARFEDRYRWRRLSCLRLPVPARALHCRLGFRAIHRFAPLFLPAGGSSPRGRRRATSHRNWGAQAPGLAAWTGIESRAARTSMCPQRLLADPPPLPSAQVLRHPAYYGQRAHTAPVRWGKRSILYLRRRYIRVGPWRVGARNGGTQPLDCRRRDID